MKEVNYSSLSLGPRLSMAFSMVGPVSVFADIGCDHGRLCCSLLKSNLADFCIAADISEPSLEKAKQLSFKLGLSNRISFRVGDGLSVLSFGEADCVAILGMGGTLISRILHACPSPLNGTGKAVFQPMRAQDDLRRYLFDRQFHIVDDRTVRENGRLYQVFAVTPPDGKIETFPDDFPSDCFSIGYHAFSVRDPLTREFALQELNQAQKRLKTAVGTPGETVLRKKEHDMLVILDRWGNG